MAKWAECIGPTYIVGPILGIVKAGGVLGPLGDKSLRPFPLIKATVSFVFFLVGLNICLYFEGNMATCRSTDPTYKKALVDLVDFRPPNPDQHHVTNSQLSISLVKSNGCDLILHYGIHGVTRSCTWYLKRLAQEIRYNEILGQCSKNIVEGAPNDFLHASVLT